MSKLSIDLSKLYKPHPRQVLFHQATEKIKLFGGAIRGGKCFTLDTPIPNSKGWSTIGEIKQGDIVFDDLGLPCKVLYKSPVLLGNKLFRIEFDDGSILKADAEHLWLTFSSEERVALNRRSEEFKATRRLTRIKRGNGIRPDLVIRNQTQIKHKPIPTGTIRSTEEMFEDFVCTNGANYSIKTCYPLQLPEKKLPIDPYLLGIWLGDGHSAGGQFTTNDEDIIKAFDWWGYRPKPTTAKYIYTTTGFTTKLRKSGLLQNKHIPEEYFRASESQRRNLLMGLMDTDGYCAEDGGCEFNNTKKGLSLGVLELARSLGIKCYFHKREAKLNGRYISQVYDVNFTTKQLVFRLPRKAHRQNQNESPKQRWHYIKNIIPIPTESVQCIEVDSPSHLYLIGESFIPTHNTKALVAEAIQLCLDYPGNVGIMTRQTLPAFKRTVMVELERYFDAGIQTNEGYKKLISQHHATDHYIKFYNGSMIWYTGLGDDTHGLVGQMGTTIGFGCIDQVEETSEIHFNNLLGRLSLPIKGIRYHMLLTANPMPGWVKQRFISNTPKDFIYIPSLPRDNPYLPVNYEAELREQYPDELARAWLDGDWNVMESGNYVFSWNEINRAIDLDIKPEGEKHLGVDISWGGTDENVAIIRQGGKVLLMERWIYRKEDAIQSVDKIISIINEHQIPHKNVNVDAVSGGSLIYSELVKRDYQIHPIIAGEKPDDEIKYINQRAEMYFQLQKRFRDNSISIPDDRTLTGQLTVIKYIIAGEKKYQLESKEKMTKSPDRADALALAFYESKQHTPNLRWL